VRAKAERDVDVGEGFQHVHEAALRAPGSLGDAGDLSEVAGEERDDLVGLAEGAGADDDGRRDGLLVGDRRAGHASLDIGGHSDRQTEPPPVDIE
jgi:hypothetical protein